MTEIARVLVAGEDQKVTQIVLKSLFDADIAFNGEKALESNIVLKSKYYECRLGLFADTLDIGEALEWVTELCKEEMKELRDALQGVILIINETWSPKLLCQLSEQLKKLAYLLDDEFIEDNRGKQVLQWDGIKSVLLFDAKVSKTEQKADELYDIMDPSTFELTIIDDTDGDTLAASFKELIQCVHSTDWRSIESISVPSGLDMNAADDTNMESHIASMLPIVTEIKRARQGVHLDPDTAADLAKHFARKVSLFEATPSLSN